MQAVRGKRHHQIKTMPPRVSPLRRCKQSDLLSKCWTRTAYAFDHNILPSACPKVKGPKCANLVLSEFETAHDCRFVPCKYVYDVSLDRCFRDPSQSASQPGRMSTPSSNGGPSGRQTIFCLQTNCHVGWRRIYETFSLCSSATDVRNNS
jgi:hypothetical protein